MKSDPRAFLAEALKLPPPARAHLATELLRSLDDEGEQDVDRQELDVAWNEEIVRRMKELDEGAVSAIPWEVARKRIMSDDNDPPSD